MKNRNLIEGYPQFKMDGDLLRAGETVDAILDGRIRVLQKRRGYRFSIDSVLLAHFIRLRKDDRAIEFGTGSAVIPLILQHRAGCRKIIGLEIQDELAEMARRSVRLNGMEDRIEIVHGDARDIKKLFPPGSFDVAFFNPPYRRKNAGRINPESQKAVARHEISGSLEAFSSAASYVLKAKGSVYSIYPAVRLAGLVCEMRMHGLEPKRLRFVHTNRFSRGEFVLLDALKGGGEELRVLPPLFIYKAEGGYTEEMEDLFKGITAARSSSCG